MEFLISEGFLRNPTPQVEHRTLGDLPFLAATGAATGFGAGTNLRTGGTGRLLNVGRTEEQLLYQHSATLDGNLQAGICRLHTQLFASCQKVRDGI